MADADSEHAGSAAPEPAEIELRINGQDHRLSYERAFILGYSLLEKGQPADAAKVFERLEKFVDRGPRAFVMYAFCECAARHFDESKAHLEAAFSGEEGKLADVLHDAFVSCHVGIRQEGINAIATLIDANDHLPSLCMILGSLMAKGDNLPLAKRCWSLAIARDRPNGAVAAAAKSRLLKLEASANPAAPTDPKQRPRRA